MNDANPTGSNATTPSATPSVILVGHCSPDSGMLRTLITSVAKDATIIRVNDAAALAPHAHPRSVWLVNRVLDGDFGEEDGLSLISRHAGGPVLLLVSNFADAQDEARRRGAMPGFGKRALYAEATKAALAAALARIQSRAAV